MQPHQGACHLAYHLPGFPGEGDSAREKQAGDTRAMADFPLGQWARNGRP